MEKKFKSGFVGLIGRTNVGKSTFINKILKQKVVISTNKSQTTRERVNCIYNSNSSQIIFVDCPGFFKPKDLLGKKLNKVVQDVIKDADLLAVMVDAAGGIGKGDYYVMESVKKVGKPKLLLLNKIDLISKKQLESEMEKITGMDMFEKKIPISAKTGQNLNICLEEIEALLPEGPKYFGDDIISDQPVEKLAADIVREKLALNLMQELPHSIGVKTARMDEGATKSGKKLINISCNIFTEKKSQKAIIIGKSGNMLKKVGMEARKELENIFECKVYLELWVKVAKNWTRNEALLKELGY